MEEKTRDEILCVSTGFTGPPLRQESGPICLGCGGILVVEPFLTVFLSRGERNEFRSKCTAVR